MPTEESVGFALRCESIGAVQRPRSGFTISPVNRAQWNIPGLLVPAALCAIVVLLWLLFGFGPLDRAELPLAAFVNGLTGRSETFDLLIIYFNRFHGEAIFVIIIFIAFVLVIRWVVGPRIDWRPVGVFACCVFAWWVLTNATGDHVIERFMPRDSPSYMLGEQFVNLEEVRNRDVKIKSRSSFPSNHGNVFFLVAFFCLLRFGHKAWVLFPLAFVLSLPRCFTGAHWISDNVIGSVLLTWLMAAIALYTPLFRLCLWAENLALRIPANAPVGEWPDAARAPTR
jgi:membrane-associated phospholipid phosphatase